MKYLLVSVLIASGAWAQGNSGNVGGPVLGMVFDRGARHIRPLLGIPGASTVGAPLDGQELRDAAVSAVRGYAVAIDGSGAAVVVTGETTAPLPGASQGAARTVVSPRGTAAALYFAHSGTVQIFTGMPDAPQLARTLVMKPAPGELALSDDGAVLLAASRTARNGDSVYAYRGDSPEPLYRAQRIVALAFVPGSSQALIAEPGAVNLVSPDLGVQPLGGEALTEITAVAASADGARAIIATRAGKIVIHDLRSSARTSVACACSPAILDPLLGNAVFRLNEMADGPLWVLDADSAEPKVYFVPSPAGSN